MRTGCFARAGAMLLLILTFFWGAQLQAQEERPYLETQLERMQIYEGESVVYTVVLRNLRKPKKPDLSAFTEFEVQPAGEQSLNSSRIAIINGRVSQQESFGRAYNYRLTPRRSGTLTVPVPIVEVQGRSLKGRSLTLQVIAPEAQDLAVVDIRADKPSVYPLQPFTVEMRIFIHKLPEGYANLDPVSVTEPPALQIPWVDVPEGLEADSTSEWLNPKLVQGRSGGFSINQITARGDVFSLFDQRSAFFDLEGRPAEPSEVRGIPSLAGKSDRYWVYTLARSFIPKRPTHYRFGPVTLKGKFADRTSTGGRLAGRVVYTLGKAARVHIKAVPEEGKPPFFTGGVGDFQVIADIVPRRARVGDPMTLTLTVTGQGNLEDVIPPDLTGVEDLTKTFKVYEATAETQGSRRLFTYSLRPTSTLTTEVPSVPFSYFDVSRERYVTVRTNPIEIAVEEAIRLKDEDIIIASQAGAPEQGIEARAEGIFANIADIREIVNESVNLVPYISYLVSLIVVYILVVPAIGKWQQRKGDPMLARRRVASRRAQDRMGEAVAAMRAGDKATGATQARSALVGLVADVAGIPEAGLTCREVADRLVTMGVNTSLVERVSTIINACDGFRYGASPDDNHILGEESRQLLGNVVKALRVEGRL